jgi:coatomer protein complex subunit alpha (xenin)
MLKNMLKIAEKRNDIMSRFYNALLLGDVPERIRVLEETGQRKSSLSLSTKFDVQVLTSRLDTF